MGATPSNVSGALRGAEALLTDNFLKRFNASFDNVFYLPWLIYGEGEMLAASVEASKEAGVGDTATATASPPPLRPRKSYTTGVPYYNVDFLGGFDMLPNDQTATPEYLIDFAPYNNADCWCNVTGRSMEPEINHGDIIALRRIKDFSFLLYGEIYAIVTTNGLRTVKRIGPSDTSGHYSLIPTNRAGGYGVQELPCSLISAVYHVIGCVRRL